MYTRIKFTLKKLAGAKQYQKLAALKRQALKEIGIRYHTDKVNHEHTFKGISYLDIYEGYFNNVRKRKIPVLEIGVKGGASLRTWHALSRRRTLYDPIHHYNHSTWRNL